MGFLILSLVARADAPPEPEACFDSVLIYASGSDEPTCWFVDGNSDYDAVSGDDASIRVRELPGGGVIAQCRAQIDNDHGHAVHWDATNSCEDDPEVLCEIGTTAGNVSTADWRIVVSASGQATLTCVFKPD